MPAVMSLFSRIADFIDTINRKVGHTVAWLAFSMAIVTFSVAALRYGFSLGWVWFQETYVWMHGSIIMLAMAYTLMAGGHVRVDIFYRTASVRYRALVDLLGTILLLLPSLFVVAKYTIPYVILSWSRLEVSQEAGGLPGLFLFKTTMLAFFTLLFLQAISIIIRSSTALVTGEYVEESGEDFEGGQGG